MTLDLLTDTVQALSPGNEVNPQASILVVDDESDNFDVIEAFLSDQDYALHYVSNGYDAITALDLFQPDVILLDVMMPGISGIDVCREIKAQDCWQSVPVIMVTALQRKEDLQQCLEAGASDFISKPICRVELKARVKSMLRIKQQYDALEVSLKRQALLEADRVKILQSRNQELEDQVQQNKTEIKVRSDLMRHNALHDQLTRLPNRTYFIERLEAAIDSFIESDYRPYAVLFVDMDCFKVINDSLGHLVGDQLLRQVANRLSALISDRDFLAHFSGDEFYILLEEIPDREYVLKFANQLLQDCRTPYIYQGYELKLNMSIGIVFGDPSDYEAITLIRNADIAMYQAKAAGRGQYKVFDTTMHLKALQRLEIETELYRAIERQQLMLCYQPIMNIQTEQLVGFEALVRWEHPQRGLVSPADFIPIAEETGFITALDSWVLQTACQQLAEWKSQYNLPDSFQISVNLSVQDLRQADLMNNIDQILETTGLSGESINLEITESIIIEDIEWVIEILSQLQARQIQVSIDDFGTGYSSLNYLHRLPTNHLKIDRSFVGEMHAEERNTQVIKTILSLSQNLGLTTVAEGIETQAHLHTLQTLGCHFGQGYYFSKPLTAEATAQKWLLSTTC